MVFLDANIPLELILTDRKKANQVQKLVSSMPAAVISMLSVHLIYYFGLKEKANIIDLHQAVSFYGIIDLTKTDYEWAKQNCADNDFEDALQVAIAVNNDCDSFVTLDKNLANNYKKHIKMILV